MTLVDDRQSSADSASGLGVALLGQLVRHLDEARHIVEFVTGQACLNLMEVSKALAQAEREADQAFQAASLLRHDAELGATGINNPSLPKAIFARRRAAVAAGATPLDPARASLLIHSQPSPVTREQLPFKPRAMSRPHCGHPTKSGGSCLKIVVVLEDGALASGCDIHLPESERPSYERQRAQTDAWFEAAAEHHASNSARMMAEAAELWLRRQAREFGRNWHEFCAELEIDVPLPDGLGPMRDSESTDGRVG